MNILYNSWDNENLNSHVKAANSITVLNLSHYSFYGKDLSNKKYQIQN